MRRLGRLLGIAVCGSLSLIGFLSAAAGAVTIDKTQARWTARVDIGTGICVSTVHFKTPAAPLSKLSEAVAYLDKPSTDASILARETRPFPAVNFISGNFANSVGDFTGTASPDLLMPFADHPQAMPRGDGRNTALRVRGYLNVTAAQAKRPVTFALNCDDACSLKIGTTQVIDLADERTSQRVTKQATFTDVGLYPVEIVYYQNSASAYLEWARALSAEPEGEMYKNPLDTAKYKLLEEAELFTARTGTNAECTECGGDLAACRAGSYCGDGLCQACSVPDHCGAGCAACPAASPLCSNSACVQCTTDAHCGAGLVCAKSGACVAPTPCTTDAQCQAEGKVCDPDRRVCELIPVPPCVTDAMCPAGQRCDGGTKSCVVDCKSDADCGDPAVFACDVAGSACVKRPAAPAPMTGGGCAVAGVMQPVRAPIAAGLLGALVLLGLKQRRRPRRAAALESAS